MGTSFAMEKRLEKLDMRGIAVWWFDELFPLS